MRKVLIGVCLGAILTLGLGLLIGQDTNSVKDYSESQNVEYLSLKREYETLKNEHSKFAKDYQTLEESRNAYAEFVSLLLHGKYSFEYEIITDSMMQNPNITVIYAEGYQAIPDNTDFQKLFLLLLIDQLGDIKTKQIEFWSNKEHALAYVSGTYEKDGIEGWSGLNSRFGLLTRDGEKASLSHILSVHERDRISFGKYTSLPIMIPELSQ